MGGGAVLSPRKDRRADLDESDVRVRPGRHGSRPRSKLRPEHADAEEAMVVAVDRGRWTCALGGDPDRPIVAMRARELGRTPVVIGDRVGVVGDLSGMPDSLARIVRVADRTSVLRRTADDTDPYERVIVANAARLVIVTALADPPPRMGLVDRCLVAAFAGGLEPLLCLTKADLASPEELLAHYSDLGVQAVVTQRGEDPAALRDVLAGDVSVLVGHSGVGKSTLVNTLVPNADRAVGRLSAIGKGRHTSTSAVAFPLPALGRDAGADGAAHDGWVVDTPGIRSFGLAHVGADDVVTSFGDLASTIEDCPRGCGHLGPPADPECALDELTGSAHRRAMSVRRLLTAIGSATPW